MAILGVFGDEDGFGRGRKGRGGGFEIRGEERKEGRKRILKMLLSKILVLVHFY